MWNDGENGCEMDEEILIESSMSKWRFEAAAVVRHLQKLMGAHGSGSKQKKSQPVGPELQCGGTRVPPNLKLGASTQARA